MEDDRELSFDEIEDVLKPPKKSHTVNIPGTKKTRKYDPSIRTVTNWFRLPHTMTGECQVLNHDSERQARNAPRMYYTDEHGIQMCRWCFIEGRDLL